MCGCVCVFQISMLLQYIFFSLDPLLLPFSINVVRRWSALRRADNSSSCGCHFFLLRIFSHSSLFYRALISAILREPMYTSCHVKQLSILSRVCQWNTFRKNKIIAGFYQLEIKPFVLPDSVIFKCLMSSITGSTITKGPWKQ